MHVQGVARAASQELSDLLKRPDRGASASWSAGGALTAARPPKGGRAAGDVVAQRPLGAPPLWETNTLAVPLLTTPPVLTSP